MLRASLCALLAAFSLVLNPAAGASGAPTDSSALTLEYGVSSDVTNEQFYEETFDDTTFLTRKLSGSPEHRLAALLVLDWRRAEQANGWSMGVRPEILWGETTQRASIRSHWSRESWSGGRWRVEPSLSWSRDRSFGLDRREAHGALDVRRRWKTISAATWDARLGGEWLDTEGSDVSTLLDRRVLKADLRWDASPWLGVVTGDVGWASEARWFPDSASRNQVQQRLDLGLAIDASASTQLALRGQLGRRGTMANRSSTRDRFWDPRFEFSLQARSESGESLDLSASSEWLRYDHPEPDRFFDYEVSQMRLVLQRDLGDGWKVGIGPRLEWLTSQESFAERYAQVGAVVEIEVFGRRGWWSVEPEVGWRQYAFETSEVATSAGAHSSYAFAALAAVFETDTWPGVRVRSIVDLRAERHRDPSQDARGLYFLVEVRRLR